MIKSVSIASVLAAVILFIQTTWFKNGIIVSASPDLAVLIILWMSLNNKNIEGLLAAFVIGMIHDLLSSSPIGFYIFLYVVPAYIALLVRNSIFIDRVFMPMAAAFFSTILKALLSLFLVKLFGEQAIIGYSFVTLKFWMECCLNTILAPLVFLALSKAGKVLITRSHTEI